MDKQTVVHYSIQKRNELQSRKMTWRNLICILLDELCQSELAAYSVFPTICHSEGGKIMELVVKRSVVSRDPGGKEEGING